EIDDIDDGNVVDVETARSIVVMLVQTGANAIVTISFPSPSTKNGTMPSSTSMPMRIFSGSFSVRRASTRTSSPSSTRPTANGANVSAFWPPANSGLGRNSCVVHVTTVPRRGSNASDMSALLHRGQRDCRGHVVAPQLSHRLPTSWKFSSGQVDTSGASAFCTGVPRFSAGSPKCRARGAALPPALVDLESVLHAHIMRLASD